MLSHLNAKNQPAMVDVGGKMATDRSAHARTIVMLPSAVLELLEGDEIISPKGPVFQTAIVAGILAAKKTSELIPMCHPIGMDLCTVDISIQNGNEAHIDCRASVHHKTGIEMEALTGATVAALTIYDMCKGVSHDIVISETRLLEKRGGKSDYRASV